MRRGTYRRRRYGRRMATHRYVALLRGINVGGRNKVPMADLRAALEDDGLQSVRTYIQSGNVLFESDEPQASLEDRIEAALEGRFGFPILVVVRSHRQLRAVVQKRSEEHTSELQSLMRIQYAVYCLTK